MNLRSTTECGNFPRVHAFLGDNTILICGTHCFSPLCRSVFKMIELPNLTGFSFCHLIAFTARTWQQIVIGTVTVRNYWKLVTTSVSDMRHRLFYRSHPLSLPFGHSPFPIFWMHVTLPAWPEITIALHPNMAKSGTIMATKIEICKLLLVLAFRKHVTSHGLWMLCNGPEK